MCTEKLMDNSLIYHTEPQVPVVADKPTQRAVLLQTKVDAQCDKLATKLLNYVDNACNGRCFWVIASYLSKVANFNLPHLYLMQPLRWLHLSFAEIFGIRKLESLGYHVALFVWSYI